jgi:hypothetical protein
MLLRLPESATLETGALGVFSEDSDASFDLTVTDAALAALKGFEAPKTDLTPSSLRLSPDYDSESLSRSSTSPDTESSCRQTILKQTLSELESFNPIGALTLSCFQNPRINHDLELLTSYGFETALYMGGEDKEPSEAWEFAKTLTGCCSHTANVIVELLAGKASESIIEESIEIANLARKGEVSNIIYQKEFLTSGIGITCLEESLKVILGKETCFACRIRIDGEHSYVLEINPDGNSVIYNSWAGRFNLSNWVTRANIVTSLKDHLVLLSSLETGNPELANTFWSYDGITESFTPDPKLITWVLFPVDRSKIPEYISDSITSKE